MRSNLHRTVVRRGLSCSCQGLSVKGDRVKIERRESFFKLPYLPYQTSLRSKFLSILLATIKRVKGARNIREWKNQSNVKNSSGSCFESWPISSQSSLNRDPREVILNPPRSVESAYLLKVNTRSVLKFHPRQNRIPERRSGAGGERGKKRRREERGGGKSGRIVGENETAILPYVLVAQEFWVNGTALRSRDFSQISVPAIWIGVVVAVHGEQGDGAKGGGDGRGEGLEKSDRCAFKSIVNYSAGAAECLYESVT